MDGGYVRRGCVCGGVNIGADLSDLRGNTAPARWLIYRNIYLDK